MNKLFEPYGYEYYILFGPLVGVFTVNYIGLQYIIEPGGIQLSKDKWWINLTYGRSRIV